MTTIRDAAQSPGDAASAHGLAASYGLGGFWVVALRGELDVGCIEPARQEVARLLRDGARPLLFDLEQVTFCDSSTLNVFLEARQHGTVALVAPQEYVSRLLKLVGLTELFPVFATLEEAEASAARGTPARFGGRPA